MNLKEAFLKRGYAPGDYFNRCRQCGKPFIGDKRASSCFDCAIENIEEHLTQQLNNKRPDIIQIEKEFSIFERPSSDNSRAMLDYIYKLEEIVKENL